MTEYEKYQKILLNYKNTKEKFYDLNFHPQRRVHESWIPLDDSGIEWIRIDDIYRAPLFEEDLININYVQQGALGNCSFISAISRVARDPILVQDLFDHTADSILGPITNSINIECGAVVIFFHAFGRETPVLIDTLIPFHKNSLLPIFSRPVDRKVSPWFCLVEKAYAKLQGSYSSIIGIPFSNVNYHLFGYEQHNLSLCEMKTKTPFEKIVKYLKQGAVMDTYIILKKLKVTEEELQKVGLHEKHSYLIEKALEYKGMRFLCLRNPWRISGWKGDWSNNSPLWTDEIKEGLNIQGKIEEGTFWMIENDYNRYFTDIEVSRPIPQGWHSKSFTTELWISESDGRIPLDAKLEELPNFVFQITDDVPDNEKVTVYFLIERRSYLQSGADLIEKDPSVYILLLAKSIGLKLSREILLQSTCEMFASKKPIDGYKHLLDGNKEMLTICIHRCVKCDFDEECSVRISCKYNFKLYNIDSPDDLIPDNESQAVFNNLSLIHSLSRMPNYTPKRVQNNRPEDMRKKIDTLNKEKEEIRKKLNSSFDATLTLKSELNALVHNVETLEYEDDKLVLVVGEIENRRNILGSVEKEIDAFLSEIDKKEKEIQELNSQIEEFNAQIKK